MNAVVVSGAGGPGSLSIGQVPTPQIGPGEALLQVIATAVNRADLMQRDGNYPPPPGASEILGLEASGTIAAVGADVAGWSVGDRAMALLSGGGYAQYVAVPSGQLMPIPHGIDVVTAAAIPEVFLTAYLTLVRLAHLGPSEIALIHAGSSGVGTAAIQIAHTVGARAIATTREPARATAPRELGADVVVVADARFAEQIRTMTDGHGADVVLDLIGAAYFPENVASCARGGRIVLTGLVAGRRTEADLGTLLANNISVIGSTLRGRTLRDKTDLVRAFTEWAIPRFADGTLRPVVDRVMAIEEVAAAHERVGANDAVGKIVLAVAPDA
jgi:putative PIG3 family NAD(P)H quinone oxidoreductase